jgi:hypothetical protein
MQKIFDVYIGNPSADIVYLPFPDANLADGRQKLPTLDVIGGLPVGSVVDSY